ncbi:MULTISPECIES: chemotaxis protein CheA [unclassified Colwellia]|uniref:chemotaxis protein CheA n=1 Tax=unclassified Colwellia TaxID=196834 RepID=UPI0015F613ED|nr:MULTISPECIES: chemotaxis protein CheA [unclassified Colwellia]MBA6233437.1 chemotaxis protein CheA [Colwellia sp. MB02u-7]MBA6236527.1 chemotaxis protein CheA [Colwellia sp. MB02u-11]MBA6257061.1 chemotaxis protein CheA [Colwellia sp. MB3u-28]MBA6260934.1 chemotaxis protein CheA [Colwellia sp. MB3u-41]MBA6298074.1 chemotaxis protein CheA [Colwellia sp. MB3u-22]
MSFEQDEEILQDFLIEAGEILETLSEQLVELENDPDNAELLNAIFRGFHTVKGGAGFLALHNLVDVCHGAENIFDLLRTNQRSVSASLMDVILQALDVVNEMFVQVQNGEKLDKADATLLAELHRLSQPEGKEQAPEPVQSVVETEISSTGDEMSEDEFERLLDELHGSGSASTPAPAEKATIASSDSNDISDDEFESLLDELHGQGAFSSELVTNNTGKAPSSNSASSDEISDDDFEALLDELHGQGQAPKLSRPAATSSPKPAPVAQIQTPKPTPVTAVAKPVVKAPVPEKAPAKAMQGETTVRVDTKRLDQIMNMVGELVLVRNRLTSLGLTKDDEDLTKAVSNLDAVTTDLQGAVMKTRMQPIKKVFGRFPRVVRDLARSLDKDIKLVLVGEETDLDKNLVEALADPLVHLVRNSVDHGIELPDKREAMGKPREGVVVLSASQEGDHILLTIKDDGAGMNAEKLKEIAIERGVLDTDAASRMTDKEAFSLIFAPGFSTKTEISEVSGRGVGMDVVKTKITQLNGTVSIDSEMGVGTVLEIKVPLTLAILPTLMVIVGKQTFALPLAGVNEIFHLDLTTTNVVDGQLTIIVRKKAIPLFYLDKWLVRDFVDKPREKGHVVIVQLGNQQIGFVVDSLIGQEEVVIKPLDRLLHGTPGMAGATITSDGGIALIIDVANMLKFYAKKAVVNKKLHS